MPKKTDKNQAEIVKVLRQCGVFVFSLHAVGRGCPDLLCGYRGRWHMAEVKNGKLSGWKLTPEQKEFHALCNAPVAILTCVDDVTAWMKRLEQLDRRKAA